MLALAVSIGVGLMITSFRATVERWLGVSLPADLYLLSPEPASAATPADRVREEWLEAVARLPEIERVNRLRSVTVESPHGAVELVALDMDARSHGAFELVAGRAETAWEAYHQGRAVLISEPLASRTRLGVGSAIELATPRGIVSLPVEGVFYDYSTDRGFVLIDLARYRALWGDSGLTAASAFVRRSADLAAVAERVRAALPSEASLLVTTQRALREESLRIFDRTFRVTAVLRSLTLVVALVGILSALMAQQLERTRELGLLRATGVTRRQLWLLVTAQTGLVGLVAGVLSLPVGIAMAAMTTLVINQRSFGWTIPLALDAGALWQAVAAAVLAALAAGVLPALRMAATSPAEALRSE
jgi:putative ABC transport system permease protein